MSRWMRSLVGSHAGEIREFPDEVAENLVDTGQGVPVTAEELQAYRSWLEGEDETATLPEDETPESPKPEKVPVKKTAAKKAPVKE